MNYQSFLESKRHSSVDFGIDYTYLPDSMFDFQQYAAKYLIKKGRGAGFLDTGLGKTLIELVVAQNYVRETNKPVLIITPLAVADQHLREADKFGIDDVEHTKDGSYKKKIVLINYERLGKLKSEDFDCVILDESSILKNFDGAIKNQITSFLKKVKYRFLFTATPSPNDFIELGTSSEALGYLGYMDMLSRFFKNNNNNVSKISQVDKARIGMEWYLKPHAEQNFWKWITTWSISLRKPSDIGFSDELHHLPSLHEITTIVNNQKPLHKNGQMSMFNSPAVNFQEIKQEVRNTIELRCQEAVNKANQNPVSVYWVNLNNEADLISQYDKCAVEIKGQMDIEKKEEILKAFSSGQISKLITKPSITSFGLNWQHCNHTVFFPTFSYEQYYQSIRRFWRFGQKSEVVVDLIISDGQSRVLQSLLAKKEKAIKMFASLTENANSVYKIQHKEFNQDIVKPKFL